MGVQPSVDARGERRRVFWRKSERNLAQRPIDPGVRCHRHRPSDPSYVLRYLGGHASEIAERGPVGERHVLRTLDWLLFPREESDFVQGFDPCGAGQLRKETLESDRGLRKDFSHQLGVFFRRRWKRREVVETFENS